MKDPIKVIVNEKEFYIHPFPAFKAANISGELIKIIGPCLSGLGGIESLRKGNVDELLDKDMNSLQPVISSLFDNLSGDDVELLLRKLLVQYKSVAFVPEGKEMAKFVSEDELNDMFSGDVQYMYLLAFEVIKVNYGGFFKKLGSRFGSVSEKTPTEATSKNTEG